MSVAALVWAGLRGLPLVGYLWWAGFGVVLAFVDVAVRRLPVRLSYATAGGFAVLLAVDAVHRGSWQPWLRCVLGALVAVTVVGGCALVWPALVHWGDARYALAVGAGAAWVGWLALYVAAFLATLGAALVGVALVVTRRAGVKYQLPQGPFWYVGTLLAVVLLVRP